MRITQHAPGLQHAARARLPFLLSPGAQEPLQGAARCSKMLRAAWKSGVGWLKGNMIEAPSSGHSSVFAHMGSRWEAGFLGWQP